MSVLQFADVSIVLAGRPVLANVSFAIERREFVGVLGPNGSGKTTLLRAILGLVPIGHGAISVFDRPAAKGNSSIGYLPQYRVNVDSLRLSGRDFVAAVVNGHRLGLPVLTRETRKEVDRALELVEAQGLARRPLAELSGGERQRLLIAQALVGRPKLLLLDEPLISLDPNHQQSVVRLIKTLQKELQLSVLFTSHELNPLLGALDRVLYLGNKQAALGTVNDVVTSPILSRLYGAPIEVVRLGSRIFVMSGEYDVERDHHRHEHPASSHHARL